MHTWIKRKVQFGWALLTKGPTYSMEILQSIYQIYLNHHKIIHYRDGHPVYSLTTPAAFSGPAANFLSRILFRTIQNKNMPNLFSFAVTDACNADCAHCSFYAGVEDDSKSILTLQQAQKVIRDAQDLGVSVINFVGGEPLVRKDLPEILKAVDKRRSTTVLFSNGWLLAEKARELRQSGLDGVYVSLDSPIAHEHDRIRQVDGLYDKALVAIQEAARQGLSTGISYCITKDAYLNGDLEKIIQLGKRIGVHEILVFDMLPTGRCKHREDLVDSGAWVDDMINSAVPYNQSDDYPGIIFFSYMTSHRSVGCSCGTSYFYLSPYGEVMSCDFNHAIFGSVLEQDLYSLWDQMTSHQEFKQAKWGGCKIKDSEFRQKDVIATSRE